ncbi:MAG: primosomal protein N', partial [Myxococcota bacterium]|nr:primosomal protein N' [Myxococcota bacterium]
MTAPLFSPPSRRAVRVALPVPIDSLFTYRVPDSEGATLLPGQRALVPFAGRKLTGVIVECLELDEQGEPQHTGIPGACAESPPEEKKPTQEIERVLDPQPVLSSVLLTLLIQAAEETLCPPGIALATALPAGSSPRVVKELRVTPRGLAALRSGGARGSTGRVLLALEEAPLPRSVLLRRLPQGKDVLDPLLADGLVREIQSMREPSVRVAREKVARVAAGVDLERALDEQLGRAPQQARLLRTLAKRGPTPTRELATLSGTQPAQLRSLVSRGLAETFERDAPRNVLGPPVPPEEPLALTDDQARVLEPIANCVDKRQSETFLLHGVTGSGKTEIYLRAVGRALAQGRQALVLVPEISLTHQIVARLRGRFGDDLAVLHSGLQPSERLEQWERLRAGKTPIAVGARSALFAPLGDIGVIVIDEEHDPAYKNEQGFRYHAGRLAERLGAICKCPTILGSATPALETRFRADRGEIQRLVLARRIGGRPLPAVEIVNLEEERRRMPPGRKLILSKPLRKALAQTLADRAQTILFLNRRGFSTRIFCFDCGFAEHCPDCDVALVYHAAEHALRCHYCEFIKPPPERCGGCGNTDTALLGTGTERLEEEVRALLPSARTARLDRDSAQQRGYLRAVLEGLAGGEIDILIGTQMI